MDKITWDNFRLFDIDGNGLQKKFEDLCRQLFVNEFLSDNVHFRTLQINPNNAGLEAEPILDERSGLWIGFQAKFFGKRPNYEDIYESAEQTVLHYSGHVDLVYLYCNLTLKTESLERTIDLLGSNGIAFQRITDDPLLDRVRKFPYLALYYFGNRAISFDWFQNMDNYVLEQMGKRFNRRFNVDTHATKELSLFVQDKAAVSLLNTRKRSFVEELRTLYWREPYARSYLFTLENAVERIPDVDVDTILDVLDWKKDIDCAVESERSKLKEKEAALEKERDELLVKMDDLGAKRGEEWDAAQQTYRKKGVELVNIQNLISLPANVYPSSREERFLKGKILFVEGFAGIGKSQLLANATRNLLEQQREVLLTAAGIYNSPDPVLDQVMQNLRLDYSLEELIDILETIGEKHHRIVPFMIDALNETWHQNLWKRGLPILCDKIAQTRYVRLVVSYRPEYRNLLFTDDFKVRIRHGDIITLFHRGFDDSSYEAIAQFFDHYGIPFTPLEYLGYEITNPLFLTLYCETYNGEEVDLPTVYERLLADLNDQLWKSLSQKLRSAGYLPGYDLIRPLVLQFASRLSDNHERSMTREEFWELPYWKEYDLTAPAVVPVLRNEHFLYQSVVGEIERYYFSYDQMNEIYVSEALFKRYGSKKQVRQALVEEVLQIVDGRMKKSENVDLFVHLCARYAYAYNEECIDVIDCLEDSDGLSLVIDRYFASFSWRRKECVSREEFLRLMARYHPGWDTIFSMLIGHSTKVSHPLNADFLHGFLSGLKLAERDSTWTIYINSLESTDRICGLIQKYQSGTILKVNSDRQLILLLTLFAWLLTSSNRWLRDVTSKAMIEILKEHFALCQPLFQKFANVDDPYVVSRLYGIVFGACSKRREVFAGEFRSLALYVYEHVFCQDKVYPDILLRDYARLIVELFCHEFPDDIGVIDRGRIAPPYFSNPIPEVEIPVEPPAPDFNSGIGAISLSMMFEGMGMYGDFGRYIFQSALRHFDVDQKKVFWYAMEFIKHDLGYEEELFEKYDLHVAPFSYDRHRTIKRERIGKKYQWIAMFNILARVSDTCPHAEHPAWYEDGSSKFEGPWDPYVRDFDPTLNIAFLESPETPHFSQWDSFLAAGREEVNSAAVRDAESADTWLQKRSTLFSSLKNSMIMAGKDGTQWVSLTGYCDTMPEERMRQDKLQVWSWQYAYFMNASQVAEFQSNVKKRISILTDEITGTHDTYILFNREYPWAPSCREFNAEAWVDVQLATGEKEEFTYEMPNVVFDFMAELKDKHPELLEDTDFISEQTDNIEKPVIQTIERDVMRNVGKILHASTHLLWESEYDASKEEPVTWDVPCAELIEQLHLSQREYDTCYYDCDGHLASFALRMKDKPDRVMVRKDLMDQFLERNNYQLVWIVQAEKEIHSGSSIMAWSEWEGLLQYQCDHVDGDLYLMDVRKGNM